MPNSPALKYLAQAAEESQSARQTFLDEEGVKLPKVAELLGRCYQAGGKLLVFGNGGSAADAQHLAAELVGRLVHDRRPLAAIALTTDTSALTAIANDNGYDQVFVRQIQALAKKGDVVLAISTSGNSPSVLVAVEAAKRLGCTVVSLTGGTGGKLKGLADLSLNVSRGKNSCRIQETHIFAIHSIVDLMERFYLDLGEQA